MEARATAAAKRVGHDEERGRLHLAGLDAETLPALPLLQKLIVDGALLGAVLPVETVLALHDTGVRAVAEVLRRLTQRERHVEVCHGGVLNGRILQRGVLVADRAGGDDHVAGLHVDVDAAAGAGADEGIRAELMQLLHRDGRAGAADAGGADRDLLAEQRAGVGGVLAVLRDLDGIIEQRGDGRAAARVTGQDYIAAHLALCAVDMILTFKLMHKKHLTK